MQKQVLYFVVVYILHFLLPASAFSQPFERTYGAARSETGTCIQHTMDGNYIISGMSNSFTNGNNDAFLIKVNPQGVVLWSKTYGRPGSDYCYYVNTCTDKGFILTGLTDTTTSGNSDLFLIKTDSVGTVQWSTTVGGPGIDYGWQVVQMNDGGFIASGVTSSYGDGSYNGYLVKTNSAGVVQWTKVFGGSGADTFNGLCKTRDGGFVVTGGIATNSFGSSDIWLLRFDANGDTLWTKEFGKPTEDAGDAVIQTSDGGFVVAGDSHTFTNNGAHRAVITKLDSLGNIVWAHVYGSYPGAEIAYDVLPDSANGYFLLCYSGYYGNGNDDVLLIHTDSVGEKNWVKTYGGTNLEDPWYLQQANDGGLMIVGATTSFGAGQYDVYLIHTDTSGASACYVGSPDPYDTIPVYQIRSGTTIISGEISGPMNPTTTIANTQTADPCAVSANEISNSENDISIYPNPSNGIFQIQTISQQLIANSQIEVYNVYGEKIYQSTNQQLNNSTINLSNAPNGVYFLQLKTEQGTATKKLVISR